MESFLRKIKKHIEELEKKDHTLFHWVILLFSFIFLRNILEGLLEEKHIIGLHENLVISLIDFFLQNSFFFIALYLSLLLLFSLMAKTEIDKVARTLTLYFSIILIVPLIDFFVSRGDGYYLGYPVSADSVLNVFINFFNPAVRLDGISIGLRIEVFLACCVSCLYVFVKSRSLVRTIIVPFFLYIIVLIHGFFPFFCGILIKITFQVPGTFEGLNEIMKDIFFRGEPLPYPGLRLSILWLLWIFYLLLLVFYRWDREKLAIYLRLMLGLESLKTALCIAVGLISSYQFLYVPAKHFLSHPFGIISLIVLFLLSLLGGFLISLAARESGRLTVKFPHSRNNLFDGATPLVSTLSFLLLFLFLIIIRVPALLLFISILTIQFLIHFPPLQLRRFPIPHIIMTTASDTMLFLLGAFIIGGLQTPQYLPAVILVIFVIQAITVNTYSDYLRTRQYFTVKTEKFGNIVFLFLLGFVLVLINVLFYSPALPYLTVTVYVVVTISFLLSQQRTAALVILLIWLPLCFGILQSSDQWGFHDNEKIQENLLHDARNHFSNGRYSRALSLFKQVLEIDPSMQHTTLPYESGIAALNTGSYLEALQYFDIYLKFFPTSVDAFIGQSVALEKAGYLEQALNQYQSLIESGFEDPKIHLMFGLALFRSGNFEEALSQFDKIKAPEETFPRLLLYRGEILHKLGRNDEADETFRKLLDLPVPQRLKQQVRKHMENK